MRLAKVLDVVSRSAVGWYLATGCSLAELHYNFRIGRSSASSIIQDVCKTIWIELADKVIPQCSTEKRIEIAKEFQKVAQFPNCIGAIDGKHIRTKQPPNSGSMYYNYKQYFSTVLFAMCDANYCFTYIDVGSYGKSSDAGIFKHSKLYEKLCDGTLGVPAPCGIDETNEKYPFVIVGDEAFPLSENLLRPYGGKQLTSIKETFNARLSRARRYIECSFGILANKWRIFHRPIDLDIDGTVNLVKAACVLHNFIRTRDGTRSNDQIFDEDPNLNSLAPDTAHRGNSLALFARDKYAKYFEDKNLE
nr:protein ALP1-like [Onthophagus taurus]